ncbi:MAG: hypothetical protein RIQ53_3893 [Pseudomonadota bacterium]|jgi:L-asparaginase
MPSTDPVILPILGTGGTIAGASTQALDNVGYTAAQIGVAQLLAAVPALGAEPGVAFEAEQVAQLDSKDMDPATWQALGRRVAAHLARPEVPGLVITHGTDTLEETAIWLQAVLAPTKPVVLTAAMRPATALAPDGPQNLLDAVRLARTPGACGVLVVAGGRVMAAADVRKRHPYRLDALAAGDAGVLAWIEEGNVRLLRPWPVATALPVGPCAAALQVPVTDWPWVEVVGSHAGADARQVDALRAAGVQGLVVATTGNGTVHRALQAALERAQAGGCPVWLASRCGDGVIVGPAAGPAAAFSPWQARALLQLWLLQQRVAGPQGPAAAGLRRPSA